MQCPHCTKHFHDSWSGKEVTTDEYAKWKVRWTQCSACGRAIIKLAAHERGHQATEIINWIVLPKNAVRPVPEEVPQPYSRDFTEACLVLADSTNASAAISRRCLQSLLVNQGGAAKGKLADQIDEVIASKQLRQQLADNLHYVRQVGNLGAHERKNANTGEVLDATPEEAEWLIEVLEGLFEHYFVEPAREQKRREEFDARIEAARKKQADAEADAA
jgi:hypothetical protein